MEDLVHPEERHMVNQVQVEGYIREHRRAGSKGIAQDTWFGGGRREGRSGP